MSVCCVGTSMYTISENCHVISEVDRNKQMNLIHTHTHTHTQTLHHRNLCSKLNWATLYIYKGVREHHGCILYYSYHMAPRALASSSHKGHSAEGNKLAKRQRGHLITGLLQFELLLCQTITEQTRLMFLWYYQIIFSTERTGEKPKRLASKATSL